MIEKMRKYSFVLYHLDYEEFLNKLQKLGMVHIVKNRDVSTELMQQQSELVAEYTETIKFLQKIKDPEEGSTNLPTKALLNKVKSAREQRDKLNRQFELVTKQIHELIPWGHFDRELAAKIEQSGIKIAYHTCLKNHFKQEWLEEYPIRIIHEHFGIIYFALLYTGINPSIEAESFSFHQHTLNELENQRKDLETQIADINEFFRITAKTAITAFTSEIDAILQEYAYEDALGQADDEADDHLKILMGWIPVSREKALKDFLDQEQIIHFSADALADDNVPIKLRNNWFARLFEPIAKLYMLPYYNEFDLTPMFAPFFMLFFGFCNADVAYGVIFLLIGLFLRFKAKNEAFKGYGMLIVVFGISSIIMGWVMGSILGYDMKKISGIGQTVLIRETGQIFNFALLLGAIQILFGKMVNTIKSIKQNGFKHGLAPFGTFLFVFALAIMGSTMLGAPRTIAHVYAPYVLYAGLALVLLFNAPGKNVIINILGGIWVMYQVVTGFFGDILSYIRLFALGVSSSILGFVMNSIAANLLNIPIAGYVIFPIFMLFGHSLNLALGALSGFVHPMRLTFVEFFNNSGFAGPGLEYKPFGRQK